LLVSALAQVACRRASSHTRGHVLARITQTWARTLLWLLDLRATCLGDVPEGHFLMVANHQSYLDILILAAHFPAQFVAKHEVSRWPLVGWLASLGGTIFVKRESTHSSVQCVYRLSRVLRAGLNVQVFPEGTTNDGTRVLPFKPLLLAAAARSQTPVLPLTINFTSVNGEAINDATRDVLCWHGEMDFARHFWRLLACRAATARLTVHTPLIVSRKDSARMLTPIVHSLIAGSFAAPAFHERTLTWHVTTKTNAPIAQKI
jgi:1-acyl-sn-glycerol-3-phosphate acyltransferase